VEEQEQDKCEDCKSFDDRDEVDCNKNFGICRFNPATHQGWPKVHNTKDWCRKFEKKK
jgi:hypothetical protein